MLGRLARAAFRTSKQADGIACAEYIGLKVFYPQGSFIAAYLADGQGWDTVLRPITTALLGKERPLIVDVGANIGASLLQFKLAKPNARIYCFEPSPRYFSCLQQTVEASGWRDVTVEPLGLSSEPKSQAVLHENATTASLAAREYDGHAFLQDRTIDVTTIDEYFAHTGPIDLLKVDTDGHDCDVLLGAETTLRRDQPILFFEFESRLLHESGRVPRELLDYVFSVGYSTCLAFSNFGDALSVFESTEEILNAASSEIYLDVLAVARPDQAAALPDLADAIGSSYSIRPNR